MSATTYMQEQRTVVGRVLRASTTGFDCGTRGSHLDDHYAFGSFVKVPLADDGRLCAIGLIYAIRIDDDPLARELVMAGGVDASTLLDQRENRMVPIEICAVNVGYLRDGEMIQSLPPRPPLSLREVELLDPAEIYAFTQSCGYFRLVLSAKEVPAEELLAAALIFASMTRPDEATRIEYLVGCGQELARVLSHDLKRLSHLLNLIRPY